PHKLVAPADAAAATETTVALRGGLEALERVALSLRFLVRSVVDSAGIASEASPVRDHMTRVRLGGVLAKLGSAVRIYGQMVEQAPLGSESLESALTAQFEQAHELQDELADVLKPRVGDGGEPSEWPLRGEILTHIDRLRTGLSVEAVDTLARVQRTARERRRSQARIRRHARAGISARATFRPPRTRSSRERQSAGAGARSRSSAHKAR
ncbi:MAG TPA: hypothetical protein VHF26_21825, partial [Trebonia sp.]|nr:hypothetical protein [Trebonia sp.]